MTARIPLGKHRVQHLLGVLVLVFLLGHVFRLWPLPMLASFDAYLYDAHVRLVMPGGVDTRVVIVDIDEKSLAEIGHWPWRRNVVADLVKRLVDDYEAAAVGFDIVFAERDTSSGLSSLEALAQGPLREVQQYRDALSGLRRSLDYDQILADVFKDRPVVLGYYFSNADDGRKIAALPDPVFPAESFAGLNNSFYSWLGYGGNLQILQSAARSAGHFNPLVDGDGISRRVPLLVEYDGAYYQALSLAVLRTALGGAGLLPGVPGGANEVEWLELLGDFGSFKVPVDRTFSALIPYLGPVRSFPYVSAVDVLQGKISPEMMQGRIVLVGTTAPGLMDLRATPVGSAYPGVEIHANLIGGMLDGNLLQQPAYVPLMEALLLILAGGLLMIGLPRLPPLKAALLAVSVLALILGVHAWLWHQAGLLLPLAANLLLVLIIFGFDMSWGYLVESRTRRQFTELFGQYVPPELVEEMARDPESYSMDGRSCELTVLFSDVRSFTTLSEGLDPRELSALMNEYLGRMTAIIRARRGTLDKYIGDAIMAFWGAPVDDPEHARHAVMAGLEMQAAILELDEDFERKGWPKLRIGVGINTGLMTVGDMGSPVRKAYTVLGDAVNLASRLEGITKEYGVGIVIGEATRALVPEIVCRELDKVRVKGKEMAVSIYEPVGLATELSAAIKEDLSDWEAALRAYRACDWSLVERLLAALIQRNPGCRLYHLYSERVAMLRESPPGEGWDGVTIFHTK